MKTLSALLLRSLLLLTAVLIATTAWAGDPVPDVDIILEQIPGGTVRVDSHSGGFDEIELKVPKDFGEALRPEALPAGWTFQVKGKTVRLSGPAVAAGRPVRFKLDAGSAPRPKKISYRVLLEGRTLLERKDEPAKLVPPQEVRGSLQGVVTMPTEVAPGEPMQMRVKDTANLPAGGTWTLSGTVVAETEPRETEETPSGEDRRRLALAVPPEHADAVSEEDLADVAAVLGAQGSQEGSWDVVPLAAEESPFVESEGSVETWTVARLRIHVPAREASTKERIIFKAPVRAQRQRDQDSEDVSEKVDSSVRGAEGSADEETLTLLGVRPTSPEGDPGSMLVVARLALDPRDLPGSGDSRSDPPTEQKEGCQSSSESASCCEEAGGTWTENEELGGFCFEKLPSDTACMSVEVAVDPELCTEKLLEGDFSVSEVPGDGNLHYFDLSGEPLTDGTTTLFASLSTSRSNLKKTSVAGTNPDGTVNLMVPEALEPGDALALRYVDAFGDVVLDVPEVPGVEVVKSGSGDVPRITDASPRAFTGQLACVCGTFPGPEAWNGLLLDGEALGPPLSASSRMAWVELPAGIAPGEHVFTGASEPGFPAEDRATTWVLQIGGQLDSSKLQRLESTPMRLWVEGTEEPVDLRVRNLTPGIISIEGGEDQVIRTSGGVPNQLQRTVRGLSPGAFDIQYELAGKPCPCGASSE